MIVVGQEFIYQGRKHRLVRYNADNTVTIKCLGCGGRTYTIQKDKLPA